MHWEDDLSKAMLRHISNTDEFNITSLDITSGVGLLNTHKDAFWSMHQIPRTVSDKEDLNLYQFIALGNNFKNLKHLIIRDHGRKGIHHSIDGFKELVSSSENLKHLEQLVLHSTTIGDEGIEYLCQSPYITKLKELTLFCVGLTTTGAERLLHNVNMKNLTTLNISENNIGGEKFSVSQQQNNEVLHNLTTLLIKKCMLDESNAISLFQNSTMSNLTTLHMAHNTITSKGVYFLSNSPYMSKLTDLDLSHCQIGDEGVQSLTHSPYIRNLTRLGISTNNIGDIGAQYIASSENMIHLNSLDIYSHKMSHIGVLAIANSTMLRNLTSFHISNTHIPYHKEANEAIERMREKGIFVFGFISGFDY
ncbi:hypothetical protein C9374_009922 [Naegleria lovaniensis]|uniref:Uncharacterized protein n=1 Tax=Naegleria lovaniensis TaxID=51637 RepID=A0AA88GIP0_NAELO|nr:uncharacterized protein C9374_009922 [Naegleria lovaniensis]KAG2375299.1 hypothetical protein C9374_009922 [Naegleria lovaniensis]